MTATDASDFVDEFTSDPEIAELASGVVSDEFLEDAGRTDVYSFDEPTRPMRLTERELADLRARATRPRSLRHPSWG